MARTLRFSFDFISPYAYVAWARVHEFAARHRLELHCEPVLFAAFLNHHGQKGPAEIESKRVYTYKHVVRVAKEHGIPFAHPPAHPFNPLLGLRLASLEVDATMQRVIVDVLFALTWVRQQGITDPQAVAAALTQAGLDGDALVQAANEPANKQRLRETTDAAIERGVFGVPTFEVDDELFWGQDSLPHLEQFLRGEDPVGDELRARLADFPAQAQRPH